MQNPKAVGQPSHKNGVPRVFGHAWRVAFHNSESCMQFCSSNPWDVTCTLLSRLLLQSVTISRHVPHLDLDLALLDCLPVPWMSIPPLLSFQSPISTQPTQSLSGCMETVSFIDPFQRAMFALRTSPSESLDHFLTKDEAGTAGLDWVLFFHVNASAMKTKCRQC